MITPLIRALGLSTAIRSLEGAAALAVHAANGGEGSTPKEAALLNSAHVDVVTLPDVPGVPRVVCKVNGLWERCDTYIADVYAEEGGGIDHRTRTDRCGQAVVFLISNQIRTD